MSTDGFFVEFDDETGEVETIDLSDGEIVTNISTIDDYVPGQEMNEIQAQEITNSIRAAGTALYVLISRAHEGKAYKALGYKTFEDYVKKELDISRNRAYQLLDLSKTVKAIESSTPDGTEIKLTEAQARDIKRELPRITERIEEETTGKTAEESTEIVDNVVKEEREKIKEEKENKKENYSSYDKENDNQFTPKDNNGGMDNVNDFDPDDFDSIDPTINNVDSALTSKTQEEKDDDAGYTGKIETRAQTINQEDLNVFLDFLEVVNKLPSIHDLLTSVSPEQKKLLSQKSLDASDYLNELLDALAIQEMSRPTT